jgi:hypothetical protein
VTQDEELLRELTEAAAAIELALDEWRRTGQPPLRQRELVQQWESANRAAEPVFRETLAALPEDFAEAVAEGNLREAEQAADILRRLRDLLHRREEPDETDGD